MTEKTQQTIKELLAKLPKDAQDTINTVDWVSISEAIGKEYLFDDGDINVFQTITGLVLAGMIAPDFYAKRIEEEVSIGTELAETIKGAALKRIFMPMVDKKMATLKATLKNREPTWHHNVEFILSGGDYSVFLEKEGGTINTTPQAPLVREDIVAPRPDKGEAGRGFGI